VFLKEENDESEGTEIGREIQIRVQTHSEIEFHAKALKRKGEMNF